MGWVMMSERELNRVEVLAQVDDDRLTVNNAAHMLGLTRRQNLQAIEAVSQGWRVGDPTRVSRTRAEQPNPLRGA